MNRLSDIFKIVRTRLFLYPLMICAGFIVPLVLWWLDVQHDLVFIKHTYGGRYELFELSGFCWSGIFSILFLIELKKRKGQPFIRLVPLIACGLVSFYYLTLISEYSIKLWDYGYYEDAAIALIQGKNPYYQADDTNYLYPPLTVQVFACVFRCVRAGFSVFGVPLPSSPAWHVVFYVYQTCQLLLIIAGYIVSYLFARRCRLNIMRSTVLVTILFWVNNPIIRTLRHNQINFWIFDLILCALLLIDAYPVLSGLAIGIAGHIKLYPFIMLIPWMAAKRVIAVLSAFISAGCIVLIQTRFGMDWSLWIQFFSFFEKFPKGILLRDNSIHSIILNTLSMISRATGYENTPFITAVTSWLTTIAVLLIGGWLVYRFIQREKQYAQLIACENMRFRLNPAVYRLYGHSIDALTLLFLLSPLVWEHYYVLAIPIVIWAVAVRGIECGWYIAACACLMMVFPTFDVFPFSYHQIAGLLWLMVILSPGKIRIEPDEPGERSPKVSRV